jgi:hypothetical protein
MNSPWVGVDLDGTLAEFIPTGDHSIGKPVPRMVDLVRHILEVDKINVGSSSCDTTHPEVVGGGV